MHDVHARSLVTAHYPLVRRLARHLGARLPDVKPAELEGAGMLGLIDAARRYDPARGVPFEAFARPRVRGAMIDSIRSFDWLPRGVRRRGRAYDQTRRMIVAESGHAPSAVEIADRLRTTVEEAHALRADAEAQTPLSLDAPEGATAEAWLAVTPDPATRCSHREVRDVLATLPDRERRAIQLFYLEERPLRQVALVLQVSESRVSQLCTRAIQRLRAALVPNA